MFTLGTTQGFLFLLKIKHPRMHEIWFSNKHRPFGAENMTVNKKCLQAHLTDSPYCVFPLECNSGAGSNLLLEEAGRAGNIS